MNYKAISLAAVAAMLIGGSLLQTIEPKNNRYHQHEEALPKAVCTDHGEDVFCTHLPLMRITTDGAMPEPYLYDAEGNVLRQENGFRQKNQETVSAEIEYFDDAEKNNHLSDAAMVHEKAQVRIRGNLSRDFEKKSYAIEFKEEDLLTNKDVSLSGMAADSDWVLHGPYMDKTLLRNYLCYNLSGEIMEYAPNVRFCELFVNEEYMGVYLLVEKIKYNEEGRISLSKTDPDIKETSYILQADRGADAVETKIIPFGAYTYTTTTVGEPNGQMEIVYPAATLTEAQRKYIENDFSRFEKTLFSFDYNKKNGYQQHLDVDSFVDYFLINEFTLNYDAVGLSTYLYKDIRGKLNLCVWDFNSAFDNYELSSITPRTFRLHEKMWYKNLFKDDVFVDQVIEEYRALRGSYFDEAYLFAYIDDTVEYLGPAIERNYEKWGYSFGQEYDLVVPAERNPRNYEESILQLKDCISLRIDHMDQNIDRLQLLSHASMNKKYNHDETTGGGL